MRSSTAREMRRSERKWNSAILSTRAGGKRDGEKRAYCYDRNKLAIWALVVIFQDGAFLLSFRQVRILVDRYWMIHSLVCRGCCCCRCRSSDWTGCLSLLVDPRSSLSLGIAPVQETTTATIEGHHYHHHQQRWWQQTFSFLSLSLRSAWVFSSAA